MTQDSAMQRLLGDADAFATQRAAEHEQLMVLCRALFNTLSADPITVQAVTLATHGSAIVAENTRRLANRLRELAALAATVPTVPPVAEPRPRSPRRRTH